jgi:hypothetical protein
MNEAQKKLVNICIFVVTFTVVTICTVWLLRGSQWVPAQ